MNQEESDDQTSNAGNKIKHSPATIERNHEEIHRKNRKYRSEDNMNDKPKNWPQRIEACCAVLLVLITGFYTYYARQQAKSSNEAAVDATESLKTIKDQFRIDQRPYISILDLSIFDPITRKPSVPTKGRPFAVKITFKNVGKSNALDTITHRHVLFGKQISNLHPEPSDNRSGTVIDIGVQVSTVAMTLKDSYTNETAGVSPTDVTNWDGSEPILIFGRISYYDLYGNEYCKPYLRQYLSSGAWVSLDDVQTTGNSTIKTSDLCPKGTTP